MYKILKTLGVENNKFFLKLYDKSLQGVNPRDEKNLTKEQKIRILAEIKRNPWYYLREVILIPVPGGKKRYELHRGNLAITWCMLHNYNSITILPRQHGKTIGCICVYTWMYLFGTENSTILFMNKEYLDSKRNLKTFKDIVECLPSYLRIKDKKDVDNIEHITNATDGNTIRAISSPMNEIDADKKGRGITSPLQFWDEIAFLKHNDVVYGSSAPATAQAKIEAKKNNKPYGITMITTPNDVGLKQSLFVKNTLIGNACRFDEKLYDWKTSEILEYLSKKSNNDFFYIEFSYKQLGRDENWFQEQCRALNNNLLLIKREILLEWTRASDISVFSEEQLESIEKWLQVPLTKLTIDKFWNIDIFDGNIDFDRVYVIGCDVGGGLSQDSSAITVIDPISLKIVADFRENKIDTDDLKKVLTKLITIYFRNSVLVIENNSIGLPVIQSLMRTSLIKNMYYEYKERKGTKIERSKTEVTHAKKTMKVQVYGMNTNSVTRDIMLEILNQTINDDPSLVATPNLYSDIKGLQRNNKGKIEHGEGEHDDCLFSYLIARYVLSHGTNLARFQIPINGRSNDDRRSKLSKMSSLLNRTANINFDNYSNYNGLVRSVIDESIKLDAKEKMKKSNMVGFYTSLNNKENNSGWNDM